MFYVNFPQLFISADHPSWSLPIYDRIHIYAISIFIHHAILPCYTHNYSLQLNSPHCHSPELLPNVTPSKHSVSLRSVCSVRRRANIWLLLRSTKCRRKTIAERQMTKKHRRSLSPLVCPSVCLSVCLLICPFLSTKCCHKTIAQRRMSKTDNLFLLSVCICLPACLSAHICQSVFFCHCVRHSLCFCLSLSLSVFLCVHSSNCLSIFFLWPDC